MKPSRRILLIGLFCMLAAGLFVAGRLSVSSKPAAKPDAQHAEASKPKDVVTLAIAAQHNVGLEMVRASRHQVVRRLHVQGRIMADPARTAEIRPLGQGRVTMVKVRFGDRVTKGQILLVYQDPSLVALDTQLRTVKASLDQAASARAAALAAYRRGHALLGGVIAPAELDRRKTALAAAEAALQGAQSQSNALHQTRALYVASPSHPGEADIVAPTDGYVTSFAVGAGDTIDPARPAVTVADLSAVWLVLSVYQSDVQSIATNGTVPFTVAALPGQHFQTAIDARSAVLDPVTGAMQVRCGVPNTDLRFRPGMIADADLPTTDTADALTVPTAALQQVDGAPTMFVQTAPTEFRQQRVRLGLQTPDTIEILDGVDDGAEIVTKGSFWLKSEVLQDQLGSGG